MAKAEKGTSQAVSCDSPPGGARLRPTLPDSEVPKWGSGMSFLSKPFQVILMQPSSCSPPHTPTLHTHTSSLQTSQLGWLPTCPATLPHTPSLGGFYPNLCRLPLTPTPSIHPVVPPNPSFFLGIPGLFQGFDNLFTTHNLPHLILTTALPVKKATGQERWSPWQKRKLTPRKRG